MQIITLELRTQNIAEMRDFYVDKLGFPLQNEIKDSFTILAGTTELTFVQEDNGSKPYYHFAMTIPENKIDEARDWLLDQGCPLIYLETPEIAMESKRESVVFFESIHAHSVYFTDSAGNIVEFIARHNLDNASTRPFDTTSIINVSEIGLPLQQNIPEVIPLLCSKFQISPYFGDGNVFQALGDDIGTFILGDTARAWYPTQRLPEIHPVRITILGDAKSSFQLSSYPYFIDTTK